MLRELYVQVCDGEVGRLEVAEDRSLGGLSWVVVPETLMVKIESRLMKPSLAVPTDHVRSPIANKVTLPYILLHYFRCMLGECGDQPRTKEELGPCPQLHGPRRRRGIHHLTCILLHLQVSLENEAGHSGILDIGPANNCFQLRCSPVASIGLSALRFRLNRCNGDCGAQSAWQPYDLAWSADVPYRQTGYISGPSCLEISNPCRRRIIPWKWHSVVRLLRSRRLGVSCARCAYRSSGVGAHIPLTQTDKVDHLYILAVPRLPGDLYACC